MNIQYVVDEQDIVYVIEVNPRASRTVPYMSKVTGVPMVNIATKCALGRTLHELGYAHGLLPERPYYAVKAPVFSFAKLTELDVSLGPEMKSTGEIMGVDPLYPHALYKAMVASHIDVPMKGSMIVTIADKDKGRALPIIEQFAAWASKSTPRAAPRSSSSPTASMPERGEDQPGQPEYPRSHPQEKIDLLLNTLSPDNVSEQEGTKIRRATVEHNIPCLTSLDTAEALLIAMEARRAGASFSVRSLDELLV